jgi:hypothetical protein
VSDLSDMNDHIEHLLKRIGTLNELHAAYAARQKIIDRDTRDSVRLAAAERDAKRYRWLRLQNEVLGSKVGIWVESEMLPDSPNPYPGATDADAAIDAHFSELQQ